MNRRISWCLLTALTLFAAPVLAQEGDAPAPYRYNEALARDLKSVLWTDANSMNWRHWSDANGVNIFHDRNNGRMRDVHMNYIRGNPSADNMMVAGPGFYIASDVKSSAYFGAELLDVRLSKNGKMIDLTNPETVRKLGEIFERHGVPYKLKTSGDLRKVELLDLLTAHGVNGARYSNSTAGRGYSWTTVWDHNAIESLRRGSSNVHVEMWSHVAEKLGATYGDTNPLNRVNNDGMLKKFAGYFTEAEVRAFDNVKNLKSGEGTAMERFSNVFADKGITVENGSKVGVRLVDGKVVVTAPSNASAADLSRAYFEATIVNELKAKNGEMARRAFGPNAEKHASAEFLRSNASLRAHRMAEGLFYNEADIRKGLKESRVKAEVRASESRMALVEHQNLRESIRSRHGVDLPPTKVERMAKAFPEAFNMKTFHTDAKIYYETSKAAKSKFSNIDWVKRIRANVGSSRNLLEGIRNAEAIFVQEGNGSPNSMYDRYNVGPNASNEMLSKFIERVRKYGGVVERVAPGDPRLAANSQGRTLMTADGRIKVLLPADRPVKKFALIDELTHVRQLSNMAKASSPAEVRLLMERAAGGDRAAKEVLLRWEIKAKKNVLLTLAPNDPARKVVQESIRRMEQSRDPFIHARRGNGSIDWKKISRDQANGLLHFTLALFLKELAVAVETGDKQVISEFFDGLMTTDFYLNYGLFSVGAQAGNLVYTKGMQKYLTKYIRPRFVNSVLHSNVVLAAGMALPQIVMGHFNGKAFAIELTGLGLSSLAVKSSIEGLRYVASLRKVSGGAKVAGRLGKMARLSNVAGWFYSAAELAVILYFGDKITQAINAELAEREAKSKLNEAIDKFRSTLGRANLSEDALNKASEELSEAYVAYRNYLYDPIRAEEVKLMARLEKLTKTVRGNEDGINHYEELAASDPQRFGALRSAAERLRKKRDAENKEAVEKIFKSYDDTRARLLDKVYKAGLREGSLTPGSKEDQWGFLGARVGGEGDPLSGRNDMVARLSRRRAAKEFESRLYATTGNRLQSYDDEAALFALASNVIKDADLKKKLDEWARRAGALKAHERALVLGEGPLAGRAAESSSPDLETDSLGLIRALAKAKETRNQD